MIVMRALLLIAALFGLVACGGSSAKDREPQPIEVNERSPISHKLAALDAGSNILKPDQVKPYTKILADIAAKCPKHGTTEVADAAVVAQERLGGSLMSVLESFDQVLPPGNQIDCNEIFATLMTISRK